jgi:hypothetical protein
MKELAEPETTWTAAGLWSIQGIRWSLRGLSDFNAFHQINANLVYLLPFGKHQRLAGNAGPLLDALIGGWHVSGIFRWTSGFPITIDNGFTWATNWNIEGDAMPNGPPPKASNPKNAIVNGVGIGPDIFADPAAAEAAFRPEWPGESGVRNNVIGDGMFNIDTGLSKDFSLGEQRRLEFSWQAFNATNSVRYDVRGAQPSLSYDPRQFGKYLSTLTTPRFMQFALRFEFWDLVFPANVGLRLFEPDNFYTHPLTRGRWMGFNACPKNSDLETLKNVASVVISGSSTFKSPPYLLKTVVVASLWIARSWVCRLMVGSFLAKRR